MPEEEFPTANDYINDLHSTSLTYLNTRLATLNRQIDELVRIRGELSDVPENEGRENGHARRERLQVVILYIADLTNIRLQLQIRINSLSGRVSVDTADSGDTVE